MDSAAFAKHLSDRVDAIRETHGEMVNIGDVADLVGTLMENMEGDISAQDIHIHHQIFELVEFIKKARGEIAALQPQEINEQHIPAATDELSAIVEATEEATNTILDAAEKLGEIGAEVGGEQEEKITDVITSIYEASNFQDITGQRINKVVSTLKHIETTINKMAQSIGAEINADAERKDIGDDLKVNDERADADLLNGPQLEGDGVSQDEIDALLASFD
ncbi:chemotaxis protein CheZ [Sneathiella sp. P13V-1]|uniref:protein phosphatase CheZ n=1 Tax=Sneathiella sp. P13V-1 TaxID=2697366 RepID=UPI00187B5AED|nr:protein phosphatase CheZ [Sneathiella sp. P13V-1]MBE7638311.1 chemotaxis protein CheZ [Sneathiella sp. P13V-1]